MKKLLVVITLVFLCCLNIGCQQAEEVAEQPSADAATSSAIPIIGSWKLNVAKSNFAEGQSAPKEQTEVYRESSPGQIELTYKNVEANGTSNLYLITFPAQGGINKWLQGDNQDMEVESLLSPNEWCMTRLQDGKQIGTLHKVISEDGKTMRQTSTEKDAQGKVVENILVYERQ